MQFSDLFNIKIVHIVHNNTKEKSYYWLLFIQYYDL